MLHKASCPFLLDVCKGHILGFDTLLFQIVLYLIANLTF